MERKQREQQDRRELVLRIGRELFFERGYENVTVKDIAQRAEYGMSSLYTLFPSKEDIYGGIILEGLDLLVEESRSLDFSTGDLRDRFLRLLGFIFEFFVAHRNHYKAVFLFNSRVFAQIPETILKAKEERGRVALAPLAGLLQEAIREGVLHPMDVELTTTFLWTSQAGIINHFVSTNRERETDLIRRHCQAGAEAHWRGLLL